jgi:uncharacterized protein (TIGR04255 family)
MPSKKYVTPPIIEAACEIGFPAETEFDPTTPGILYTAIKDRFPKRGKRSQRGIGFGSEPSQVQLVMIEAAQFTNESETMSVIVSPKSLLVSAVAPYPTWEVYKECISHVLTEYQKIVKLTHVGRLGLRYINHVKLAGEELTKYFRLGPSLPDGISTDLSSLNLTFVTAFNSDHEALRVIFDCPGIASGNVEPIIRLDLDYSTTDKTTVRIQDLDAWLESAHSIIETYFEASITDVLRKRFDGNGG